jgi:protein SCO1/2
VKALRIACLVAVAAVGALGIHRLLTGFVGRDTVADLPRLGRVPDFAFVSERGRAVAARDLEGKTWVADFVFTRCGGSCPMMSERMAALATELKDAASVRLVSFDVDPERDSLADLAAYSKEHHADPDRWVFLRGERPVVRALATSGFKLSVEDGHEEDPEPILHSSRFVLVDAKREIRGYYDGLETASFDRLVADARRLARD